MEQIRDCAAYGLAVKNIVREVASVNSEELHVRAGQEILRILSNGQNAQHGRDGLICGSDHFCRGQLLIQTAIIGDQYFFGKGLDQVFVLKLGQVEVRRAGDGNGLNVEGAVSVPPLFIEHAFILRRRDAPSRTNADVDHSFVPNRR